MAQPVVKILCSGAEPDYLTPWQVGAQEQWLGSGCIIRWDTIAKQYEGATLVITNAHVVDNAFYIHVRHQAFPAKFSARVHLLAPELDLALLIVRAPPGSLDTLRPAEVEPLQPELFTDVLALGYGQGGETVCMTKGVLSRIDVQHYAYLQSLQQ